MPDEMEACCLCGLESHKCTCTGGPQAEPECTCYELVQGLGGTAHQMGCVFYGRYGRKPQRGCLACGHTAKSHVVNWFSVRCEEGCKCESFQVDLSDFR